MSVQLIVCPWVASTRLQRGNLAQIMKAAASAVRRGVLRRWLQYTHTYTRLSTLMKFWENFTLKQKHTLFPQIMFTTIILIWRCICCCCSKGGFFSERAIRFLDPNLKKKIPKNYLEFEIQNSSPKQYYVTGGNFKFQVQHSFFEYFFRDLEI